MAEKKAEKLPMRALKVLLTIHRVAQLGFAPSDEGIRQILIGAPEALAFSEVDAYASYAAFSSRKEKALTRALEKQGYVKASFLEGEEEYYFLLTEKGQGQVDAFLLSGQKVINRHAQKRKPRCFVRKENLK